MRHSNMSVECIYHCKGVCHEKYFLVWLLFFVNLCGQKKAGKGTEVQFLCTQGTLQGWRVEDHRLMFTRNLHPPQLYIQAILYIYKTDYMMSLTLYTLTSVCIFFILYSICFLTIDWCLLGTCTHHNFIFKRYSTYIKLITWCL